MNILAIIVTYYPEKELLERNIFAFIDNVERVLIWENTPDDMKLRYRFFDDPKVEYCGDGVNSISHALNYAWRYAEANGYDYLLTMDQDSVFENFAEYINYTIVNEYSPKGIWSPRIVTGNNFLRQDDEEMSKEVFFCITSGMLLKIDVIREIGGWNEAFSIDGIDCEFCFYANRVGVNIYCLMNVFLHHQLGVYQKVHLMGRSFELRNYSPKRYYDIYRSHVILTRMFPEQKYFQIFCRCYWGGMIKWIFIFEKQRFKKLYLIVKGIIEGCLVNVDSMLRESK